MAKREPGEVPLAVRTSHQSVLTQTLEVPTEAQAQPRSRGLAKRLDLLLIAHR